MVIMYDRVGASFFHIDPYRIKPVFSFPMHSAALYQVFRMYTTTTICNTSQQVATGRNRNTTTITTTFPSCTLLTVASRSFNNNQPSKPLPGQIFQCRHLSLETFLAMCYNGLANIFHCRFPGSYLRRAAYFLPLRCRLAEMACSFRSSSLISALRFTPAIMSFSHLSMVFTPFHADFVPQEL